MESRSVMHRHACMLQHALGADTCAKACMLVCGGGREVRPHLRPILTIFPVLEGGGELFGSDPGDAHFLLGLLGHCKSRLDVPFTWFLGAPWLINHHRRSLLLSFTADRFSLSLVRKCWHYLCHCKTLSSPLELGQYHPPDLPRVTMTHL